MKTWVKALLGLGAAATVTGIVAAITGRSKDDQGDEYEVEEGTDTGSDLVCEDE